MKFARFVLVAALMVGAAVAWDYLRSHPTEQWPEWVPRQLAHWVPSPSGTSENPAVSDGQTIRIATFNVQVFGQSKLRKPEVMKVLARVIRRFDVVAIQEIRSKRQDVLPRLLEYVNADGSRYDYAIGPRLGRSSSMEQYAFVFNTATVELDRTTVQTVVDRGDRLHREPLVALFRARGPPPEQAFTFLLVNIHTDPDEVPQELKALAAVYQAVRQAPHPVTGRLEDDVILLGDLNTDAENLGPLGRLPYLMAAITAEPTNTRRTKQYDNILFHREATREFTGRAGVLDLQREFGLSLQQALRVSDHLPVWAEFTVYEGGKPGFVAAAAEEPVRR